MQLSVHPLQKRWTTQKQKNSSAICLLLLSRSTFTTFMQRFEFIKNQHKCKSGIISPITPDFLLPYQCSVYIFPAVRHKKLWFSPQLYKQKKTTDFSVVVVGMTGFEPAASWSQTRRSTKLSHIPLLLSQQRKLLYRKVSVLSTLFYAFFENFLKKFFQQFNPINMPISPEPSFCFSNVSSQSLFAGPPAE